MPSKFLKISLPSGEAQPASSTEFAAANAIQTPGTPGHDHAGGVSRLVLGSAATAQRVVNVKTNDDGDLFLEVET